MSETGLGIAAEAFLLTGFCAAITKCPFVQMSFHPNVYFNPILPDVFGKNNFKKIRNFNQSEVSKSSIDQFETVFFCVCANWHNIRFFYIKFFNSILKTFNFYTDSLYILGIQGVPKKRPHV